jgi:hypothetical protein
VETVKWVLLTCGGWYYTETSQASGVCYGAHVVSFGWNVERGTAELYGYSHVRVAWDYRLHVNQLATLMVNAVTNVLVQRLVVPSSWAEPGIWA